MILIASFLFVSPCLAQQQKKQTNCALVGLVNDSFLGIGLPATVYLMNKDSVVLDSAKVKLNKRYKIGQYSFSVSHTPADYIIKAVYKGYETKCVSYRFKRPNRVGYNVAPEIKMKRKQRDDDIAREMSLDGVTVTGTRIQMTYRGDTLVYDASAFNLPEGSMLDGLIRQMPGAELKDNGDIYIKGRKVDYLMLNGKDFFKGKNKIMLENLPYFTVKELKVYDRDNDMGIPNAPKDYVMDVALKREYATGYLVNSEAGVGTNDRWLAKVFGLYYNDVTRVATFFNANNVNENRKPGTDGDWSPKKQARGQLTMKQAGTDIETSRNRNKVENGFSASVEWNDTKNESRTVRQNFASNGNIGENAVSIGSDDEFELSIEDNWKNKDLRMNARINLEYSNRDRWQYGNDSTFNSSLVNSSLYQSQTKRKDIKNYGYFKWTVKAFESGDLLDIKANYTLQRSRPSNSFSNNATKYEETSVVDRRNYYTNNRSEGYDYRLATSYMYRLNSRIQAEFELSYSQNYSRAYNDNYRLDQIENSVDELGWLPSTREEMSFALETENSYDHTTLKRSYCFSALPLISTRKYYMFINLPVYYNTERMNYSGAGVEKGDTIMRRKTWTFNPMLNFYTTGRNRKELKLYSHTVYPDMATLVPSVNNTNPLAIRKNNPGLGSRTSHTLNAKLNHDCDSIDMSYWLSLDAEYVHGAWGTRATYDSKTGGYTYMSDNVDGNWDATLKYGMTGSFDSKRRLRYTLNANVGFNHSVDFGIAYDTDSKALSRVNTIDYGIGGKLSYRLGQLTAGVNAKVDAKSSRSKSESFTDIDVCDFQYGTTLQYTVPLIKLNIATDLTMYSRQGYESAMMNTNDLVWNAQLSRTMLKGRLTAKLTAYDILHELSNKRYSVNAQGRTETWYNSVPRYVMFSLAYRLHVKPKKK